MIQEETAAALAASICKSIKQRAKPFAGESTWALQEVMCAYCKFRCPDDLQQEMTNIIGNMSPKTTLVEAVQALERWAEGRIRAASS